MDTFLTLWRFLHENSPAWFVSIGKKQVHVQCARANARRGPEFPLAFQLAILQVDDYSVYRSTEGLRDRSGVPVGPSFGRKFHTNGLPLICIQNSRRPVGLQAEMSMETAGLAVHLHVHTARELAFLPIETNHAGLFSYGNLHGVKNVSILAHFLKAKMCPFWHIF